MTKCKSCGADLVFIRTKSGKYMPCDARPRWFAEVKGGSLTYVTPEGAVKHGEFCSPGERGYIPHWVTCPAASKWRKR